MPRPKKQQAETLPTLPTGLKKSDLVRPGEYTPEGRKRRNAKPYYEAMAYGKNGEEYNPHEYEMWYTERFGWVLPTLLISRGKRDNPDRYYGITVGGVPLSSALSYSQKRDRAAGGQVRIGNGPHVLHRVKIYIKKETLDRLFFLVDLYNQGLVEANETRDRLSTKRARTAARRNLDHLWR